MALILICIPFLWLLKGIHQEAVKTEETYEMEVCETKKSHQNETAN